MNKDLPINSPEIQNKLKEAGLLDDDQEGQQRAKKDNVVQLPKPKREAKEITALELLKNNIKSIPMLYAPIFPKTGLVALVGASDCGKSSLLRQMALCTVSGIEFLGFKNYVDGDKGSCIYVSTEDDYDAMSFLIKKQNSRWGLMDKQIENLRFIFDWDDDLPGTLRAALDKKKAGLIIIDCFSDLYSGRMSQANEIRTFLQKYKRIADDHKCLVMFLHHTGKGKEKLEPNKNNINGSQAFEAKMRCVVELQQDPVNPDVRHFCITKGNYLPKQYKHESYKLEFDDRFSFTNTNERVAFESIASNGTSLESKREYAQKLRSGGMTQREISKKMGVSLGTVSNYLKTNVQNEHD